MDGRSCGRRRRGGPARILLPLVTVGVLVGVTGCGSDTPLCDEGTALVTVGRLDAGAEKLALARERGEGDCGGSGLAQVGDRYGDAFISVARGRVAEEGGDVETATVAYRAAVAYDNDNVAALEALARLQEPVPQLRAPDPVPPRPAPEPVAGVVVVLTAISIALLAGLIAVLGWIGWTARRRLAEAQRAEQIANDRLRAIETEVEHVKGQVTTAAADLRDRLARLGRPMQEQRLPMDEIGEAVDGARTDVQAVMRRLSEVQTQVDAAAGQRAVEMEQHLDDIVRALSGLMANGGRRRHDRFVRYGG